MGGPLNHSLVAQFTYFDTWFSSALLPCNITCVKETHRATCHSYRFFFFFRDSFKHWHGSVVEHLLATQKTWVQFQFERNIFYYLFICIYLEFLLTDIADFSLTTNDVDAEISAK